MATVDKVLIFTHHTNPKYLLRSIYSDSSSHVVGNGYWTILAIKRSPTHPMSAPTSFQRRGAVANDSI